MPSIPVDVLREILEHVHEADLATLCRAKKICCSYSQDVLYRDIKDGDAHVIQTLAQSTDLARRVRSFETSCPSPELATALRNMSSLRWLSLWGVEDEPILDGCIFKLDKLFCSFSNSKPLQQFINSQPHLTHVVFFGDYESFDEGCLPNLTRVMGIPSLLRKLIPGRPVRDVTILQYTVPESVDFRIFTLSAAPIQRLYADYNVLYPTSGSFLVSIFPSLVRLDVHAHYTDWDNASGFEDYLKDLLASFVSLRNFVLNVSKTFYAADEPSFIMRVSDRAPHLEYFTVARHCWKRVGGKWVICDEAERPSLSDQ